MTLRLRLILLFFITSLISLSCFALFSYLDSQQNREDEFFYALEKEAITKADLFFKANVADSTLHAIYESNRRTIFEVEVAIYALPFQLIYHDAVDIDFVKETPKLIKGIAENGKVQFYQEDWQIVGIPYIFNQQTYVITAAAYDESGHNQLTHQRNSSLLLIASFSVIIIGIGAAFAHFSLKPLRKMTKEISNIQISGLDRPISAGKFNDELKELANIFNHLLKRMHQSFDAQKEVVAHMSHEFRTPLAALMMDIELTKTAYSKDAKLLETLNSLEKDALRMKKLSDSLMDLAKAQYDHSEVDKTLFRLDELVYEAHSELLHSKPNYKIEIHYNTLPETTDNYQFFGNTYLLKLALLNLMDNACKYSSPSHCKIKLSYLRNEIQIQVIDYGKGIHMEDLPHIFNAFYRSEQDYKEEGFGIGLALTYQILNQHGVQIKVDSKVKDGTTITLIFKKN